MHHISAIAISVTPSGLEPSFAFSHTVTSSFGTNSTFVVYISVPPHFRLFRAMPTVVRRFAFQSELTITFSLQLPTSRFLHVTAHILIFRTVLWLIMFFCLFAKTGI